MKQILWDNNGYTITEQLIAALFAIVVVGTLYGFYRDQLFHLVSQEAKTATLEDARGALDIMIRDLRNAGSWGTGSAPAEMDAAEDPKNIDDPNDDGDAVCNRVYAATANSITVQMDIDTTAGCYSTDPRETITYALTDQTDTCPAKLTGKIIRRNNICLVDNVVALGADQDGDGSPDLFTYYSAGSTTPLSIPIADLNTIRRVRISFRVQETNPDPRTKSATPNISSTLSSSVEFRN